MEAATIDGAGPFKIFYRIMVPQIMGTIIVVWTTITVLVLKVFDIVFVMTSGQHDTEVIANRMFREMFSFGDFGRSSALAVVLLVAVIPVMIYNVRSIEQSRR